MVSHEVLVAELNKVNSMSTDSRLNHAQRRRTEQVRVWNEYEKRLKENNNYNSNSKTLCKVKFNDCISLLEAAARNDVEEVRLLLKDKVNPNEANEDGLTALHQACIDNFAEIVQVLLDSNADVNAVDSEFWTPLHAACTCGHTSIAKILVQRNADLLAMNADHNMPYDICEENEILEFIEQSMAKKGITQEQINVARTAKEKKIVSELKTALLDDNYSIESKDKDGATILHIAAANGYTELTRFYLQRTRNVDVKDNDGWTPLHAAACWCQLEIVEILGMEFNADPGVKNKMGEIPLDVTEDEEIRVLLIKLKTTRDKKNRKFPGISKLNGRNSSTRSSGLRSRSFKGRSKRDKNNGISAVEAKSEAQYWIKGQETGTDMLNPNKPHSPKKRADIELVRDYSSSSDDDDVTDTGPPANKQRPDAPPPPSERPDSPKQKFSIFKTLSFLPKRNGFVSSKKGETSAEYKKRRSLAGDDVTDTSVTYSMGSKNLGEEERKQIFEQVTGKRERRKKSCAIL